MGKLDSAYFSVTSGFFKREHDDFLLKLKKIRHRVAKWAFVPTMVRNLSTSRYFKSPKSLLQFSIHQTAPLRFISLSRDPVS